MPLSSLLRVFAHNRAATDRTLRVGVVGAGRMGQYHIRHLLHMPGAVLAGLADSDTARCQTLAKKSKCRAFLRAEDLLDTVDAVVIATPTSTHYSVGRLFLEAGVACLIEKPLTATVEDAEKLIALSESKGTVLQVGHIERFNPAVTEAQKFIRDPQFIEVNRLGPYDPRVAEIGVVLDLMIHDLDIVLFLVGDEVARVEAFGARVLSNHEDIAKVRIHFKKGCIADLSASRVSIERYRRIRVFQKDAYLSLDYAAPHLKIYRKKKPVIKGLRDIEILKPKLSGKDPLRSELEHFLNCVRDRKTPLVSGRHGRDALALARMVLDNLKVHG